MTPSQDLSRLVYGWNKFGITAQLIANLLDKWTFVFEQIGHFYREQTSKDAQSYNTEISCTKSYKKDANHNIKR